MLEYIDLTHLPLLDDQEPSYRYRRHMFKRDSKPVFLDGSKVYRQQDVIADCQSFKPVALATKYFPAKDDGWRVSDICLLADTRQEYRWSNYGYWILLDEPITQEDYYVEEEKGYPQVL